MTSLLERWSRDGQQAVLDRLVVALQADLRRLARAHMAREKANHTLQVTALVNETYIRLVDQRRGNWQNRAHFLGIAAGCMRRILVDHARRRKAQKRPQHAVDLDDIFASGVSGIDDVLPVHEALEQLAKVDPEQAQIVDLRFFAGLTIEEIAALRKISPATVKRELMTARVFLKAQLLDQRHDT